MKQLFTSPEGKNNLKNELLDIFHECEGNHITIVEMNDRELDMLSEPLIGFASAEDPLFEQYKQPDVIGPCFLSPTEWLPEAKTVISMFFPYTEQMRNGEKTDTKYPSYEWLYGRIEGHAFVTDYITKVQEWFTLQGIKSCVPTLDERFQWAKDEFAEGNERNFHTRSSWSERHAAYACGLGTFGLSKGLITKAGVAGRFSSIIIDVPVTPDVREYTGIYDYCTRCGMCAERCPSGAITLEHGKNHYRCSNFLAETKKMFAPRYSCGKCQTDVPCEYQIPQMHDYT